MLAAAATAAAAAAAATSQHRSNIVATATGAKNATPM